MIPRYSRTEMTEIWDTTSRFQIWLDIEKYACESQEQLGVIPKGVAKQIDKKGKFEIDKIDAIEKEVKHDVIAFLTNVAEHVGPKARFIHQGMTSSDVLDTCLNVQLMKASKVLDKGLSRLLKALKKRALSSKNMVCIGRSHGIHAEPTTMGLKFAYAYAEFNRCKERLAFACKEISTCKISGAVGTFANIDPRVERYVAKKMKLQPETISTQISPRDRHAMYFSVLGVIASCLERVSIEIRHLQRTEVREAEEKFTEGQKGSSAMPHKRNPVLTENITGLARLVRSAVIPAQENVALWHERDISHSSVERVIAPDATVTLDFAINRLASVIENLVLYPDNMQKNLNQLGGLHFSQGVMLALTQAGMSRENAYKVVQQCAMDVWHNKSDFKELLINDKNVKKYLNIKEIEGLFDIKIHIKNVPYIFNKVFNTK
ncbi:MAG: adenylosuccinate lyase [Alphaproteobacteria bacterium]|nr:adenylosuccinate lyase [Alphaproteobacteria bacterium]